MTTPTALQMLNKFYLLPTKGLEELHGWNLGEFLDQKGKRKEIIRKIEFNRVFGGGKGLQNLFLFAILKYFF